MTTAFPTITPAFLSETLYNNFATVDHRGKEFKLVNAVQSANQSADPQFQSYTLTFSSMNGEVLSPHAHTVLDIVEAIATACPECMQNNTFVSNTTFLTHKDVSYMTYDVTTMIAKRQINDIIALGVTGGERAMVHSQLDKIAKLIGAEETRTDGVPLIHTFENVALNGFYGTPVDVAISGNDHKIIVMAVARDLVATDGFTIPPSTQAISITDRTDIIPDNIEVYDTEVGSRTYVIKAS